MLIKQRPDLFFTWCSFCSLIIFISASLKLLRLLGTVKESCIDFSLNIIPSLFPSCMSSPTCWVTCGGGYSVSAQSRALSTEPRLPDLQSLWWEGLDLERLDCILWKSPQPFLSKSISVVKEKKKGGGGSGGESLWNHIAYYYHHRFFKAYYYNFSPKGAELIYNPTLLISTCGWVQKGIKIGGFFSLQEKVIKHTQPHFQVQQEHF